MRKTVTRTWDHTKVMNNLKGRLRCLYLEINWDIMNLNLSRLLREYWHHQVLVLIYHLYWVERIQGVFHHLSKIVIIRTLQKLQFLGGSDKPPQILNFRQGRYLNQKGIHIVKVSLCQRRNGRSQNPKRVKNNQICPSQFWSIAKICWKINSTIKQLKSWRKYKNQRT